MSGSPPVDDPTPAGHLTKNTIRKNTTKQKTRPVHPCHRGDNTTPAAKHQPASAATPSTAQPAVETHPGIRLRLDIGARRPDLLLNRERTDRSQPRGHRDHGGRLEHRALIRAHHPVARIEPSPHHRQRDHRRPAARCSCLPAARHLGQPAPSSQPWRPWRRSSDPAAVGPKLHPGGTCARPAGLAAMPNLPRTEITVRAHRQRRPLQCLRHRIHLPPGWITMATQACRGRGLLIGALEGSCAYRMAWVGVALTAVWCGARPAFPCERSAIWQEGLQL